MKMRVVRPFLGDNGIVNPGEVLDVAELRARELEKKNLAVPLVPSKAMAALGGNREAASEGAPRPTQTPPTGGQTGGATPVSSLPPAPAPQKRKYTRRKAKPA